MSPPVSKEAREWVPIGEEDGYNFVKIGNYLLEVSSLLYFVCYMLSIWATLEQPRNSCMMDCASLKAVAFLANAQQFHTYVGAFGGPAQKPLRLLSTWECMQQLERERPDMLDAESLVVRSESGFTGCKDRLSQSQIYTQGFGQAVCEICHTVWLS